MEHTEEPSGKDVMGVLRKVCAAIDESLEEQRRNHVELAFLVEGLRDALKYHRHIKGGQAVMSAYLNLGDLPYDLHRTGPGPATVALEQALE